VTRKKDLSWLPAEIRPRTLEQQWQSVQEWYQYLQDEKESDRPVVESFNEAWTQLAPLYEFQGKCVIERGSESVRVADAPLAALFYHIESGFYPPPELLLALLDAWQSYRNCGGHVSLEEAFLGPPKPKSGNYAKRKLARLNKMQMTWEMTKLLREGKTRIEAAECIADESRRRGFEVEPETIVRTIKPFSRAKPEK